MKFMHLTDRQICEALDLAEDPDICAVEKEEVMRAERAEVDQIMAEVDRELAAEVRTESVRIDRAFLDERRARRIRRRTDRAVLRSLPTRLDRADVADTGTEAA